MASLMILEMLSFLNHFWRHRAARIPVLLYFNNTLNSSYTRDVTMRCQIIVICHAAKVGLYCRIAALPLYHILCAGAISVLFI